MFHFPNNAAVACMKKLLILVFSLLSIHGCHDSLTVIKGCCQDPALYSEFADGRLFIPNVFTPNNDGVNDRLFIYGDSIRQILDFEIKNYEGVIVFNKKHLPVNDYASTWDGSFNDKVEQGVYSFVIFAESIKGYVWTVKGNVCICTCYPETDKDFIPMRNCQFGLCDTFFIHGCPNQEYSPCFE